MAKTEAFITLKDHKEDFTSNPKCRLINPAKSELGKVRKSIIEKINVKVREMSSANQWKNTEDVIKWFRGIQDKDNSIFIQFDIAEFYPSISKDLLLQSINHAKQFISISQRGINVIMHVRKAILFNDKNVWIKKNGNPSFDVTMGSFDSAELCELVGLYILHILGNIYGQSNLGLYRDDGLACLKGISGPTSDRIRKSIISLFK